MRPTRSRKTRTETGGTTGTRSKRIPIPSTRRAILRTEGAALLTILLLTLFAGTSPGEGTQGESPREIASLINVPAAVEEPAEDDAGSRESAVLGGGEGPQGSAVSGDIELPGAPERRIYILKMESRAEQTKELLELQRNLLKNQLMVLRVLGIIGMHQEAMGQRLSRTENINRELLSGMQDTNRGVETARADISSTLAETTDISEMTEELMIEIEEMQEQLEDIDSGISGLQDTADDILQTTGEIASGMQ